MLCREQAEECTVEDSASVQRAVKYEENMHATGYRGKAIQITKNECVCRCTRRCVCVRERDREEYVCVIRMCVTSLKSFLLRLDSI